MLLCDTQIASLAKAGMIKPFLGSLTREVPISGRTARRPVISYGLSSYGYDLRLSSKEFLVFQHVPGTIVDPKEFNPHNLRAADLESDSRGQYFVLPGNSYGLGVALERLEIPDNVAATCVGKSTYARVGVIANITPVEAGWEGYLTLEFSNSSAADVRIYANEGVVQLLFHEGEQCRTSYSDRKGKYQGQGAVVTLARV